MQFRNAAAIGGVLYCAALAAGANPQADVAAVAGVEASAGAEADAGAKADARALIAGALDLTRGLTSVAEFRMTITRPDWQRSSTLKAWTRGREDALMRFTAPPRDAGNATLKRGEQMWTFTPRVNRTIRLPQSLMASSWAGSDFSYNDLSRADDLLRHYDLTIAEAREDGGHRLYTIDAVPKEQAPVVWGKERVVLRDDYVLLSQTFFDQSLVPVKQLEALEIGELGGRTFGVRLRMRDLEEANHFTELEYLSAAFDVPLEDRLFTQFSLKAKR